MEIKAPQSTPADLSLDAGEREAIALALELGAERLLMDERQGREAAQARGLKVAGTLAVILDGAMRGLFDGRAVIEKLGGTNFYASPELLAAVSEKLTNIKASPAPDLRIDSGSPRGKRGLKGT